MPLNTSNFDDNIEEALRKAREAGQFDGLRGHGQPLRPDFDAKSPLEATLEAADYVPEWLVLAREIDARHAELAAQLARTHRWLVDQRAAAGDPATLDAQQRIAFLDTEAARARRSFRDGIVELNTRIAELNLKVPLPRFQRFAIDADAEIARLTSG